MQSKSGDSAVERQGAGGCIEGEQKQARVSIGAGEEMVDTASYS